MILEATPVSFVWLHLKCFGFSPMAQPIFNKYTYYHGWYYCSYLRSSGSAFQMWGGTQLLTALHFYTCFLN